MSVLTLTGALGAVIFASAHTMHGAMIGRIMLGLGMACNLMGSMKLFTRWFSAREFATLSGLMLALGTLGNMLAATPLAMLVETAGWRWAFGSIGLFTAASGMVFFVLVRDDPATPAAPSQGRPPSLREMAQTLFFGKEYWIISCGAFFRYGAFVAIQGLWAGPYLMEVQGMSTVEAGNYLLLINLGLILGSPLGGWLSDRVLGTRKWVAAAGLAGVGACELALGLWPGGEAPALLGAVLLWLGVSSAFGIVMYAHIKEVMPPEMSGLALTGLNFFTMVGGGVFLHVMGLVLDVYSVGGAPDAQGYSAAFLMSAAAIGLALGLYIFTRDAAPGKA
jgi:predicted MFS family arabinose efflux permease